MIDWIIIADADTESLKKAERILKNSGKRVTALWSGGEVLTYVRKYGFPDVILLAVDLPDLSGFEVLNTLKNEISLEKEIPIIFLTDDARPELEKKILESGAMDVIKKPFDEDLLLARLQKNLKILNILKKFEKDARTDLLTGFLNKKAAEADISALCEKEDGMLLVLDLDSFKSINDVFGHDMGDRVLIMFALLLRSSVKNEAVFGRIGGDEFIAFIRGMKTGDELSLLTEKLNSAYRAQAKQLTGGRMPIPIGISIGAVKVPEYGRDFENLMHLADQALYFVKQNGKHGCKLFRNTDPAYKKNSRFLDLDTVTAILEERNSSPNAMWMGNEVFGSIYRYMVRYMNRYHAVAYRVLFTVRIRNNVEEIRKAEIMIQFRKLVQNSLRNSDVMMDCGEYQLFLLLPEVQDQDIEQIMARLLRLWEKTEYAKLTHVSYEAAMVNSQYHAQTNIRGNRNPWVIVVDDDEVNREIAGNILQSQNMLVSTVKSGQELIKMVENHRPDLILLDLYMPEMDGFATLHELRKHADPYNEIPVIVLTGDDDYETEVRCLKLGVMDFIKKPFIPEVLIQRVTHSIELKHLQRNLAETVHRKTQENENLSLHVVYSLSEAIDAKDAYTNSHSTKVAEYAKEISRRYGYSASQQQEVYLMALLHDIGKIGIPDAVINKPGKLTPEEFQLIKRHPVVGAKILQNIEEMPSLSIGARWHHERYDGSGYPDGLAGEDIPEAARIIALADAYDAMTSKRSYRDALPQDLVKKEIKNASGTQFDPKFASILLDMIDEDQDYKMRG